MISDKSLRVLLRSDRMVALWGDFIRAALMAIMVILIAMAEMYGAKSGIGYLIWSSWETFAVARMYVGLFVIALIGFAISILLNEIERRIVRWKADV